MPSFKGLKDTLNQVKHRKPQPVFCPKCLSAEVSIVQHFGIMPTTYRCNKCGYEGYIMFERDESE